MCLKTHFTSVLHQLALRTGASTARAKAIKAGRILMFHGVGDEDYPAGEFEAHLRYLKRNFDVIAFETLLRRLAGFSGTLASSVVLTFDDGLRNNFTVAYPILLRLNLPATFFVCPGLIESQRWLWNQEARARLCVLSGSDRWQFAVRWQLAAGEDLEKIIEAMKTLPLKRRHEIEQALRELTPGFQASPEQCAACDVMSWDQLRSMDRELITVGSHTVNHPILSTLPPDQLRFEIIESRRWLEDKLGREVKCFCYPNGALNPAVVAQVRQVYAAAVTTERGFVISTSDRHGLPRISSAETLPLLAWRMHRPGA